MFEILMINSYGIIPVIKCCDNLKTRLLESKAKATTTTEKVNNSHFVKLFKNVGTIY